MEVRNATYSSEDGRSIDCEVNHPKHGWIPFTASLDDVELVGPAMHALLEGGAAGKIAAYVAPPARVETPLTPEQKLANAGLSEGEFDALVQKSMARQSRA